MRPGSMNGQGHVTKARSDMTLEEMHGAYDALLLDKMQVVDQKDRLFGRLQEAKALIVEHEATIDTVAGLVEKWRVQIEHRPDVQRGVRAAVAAAADELRAALE